MTQNNLGGALYRLGQRQSGKDAIARLNEAITAYDKALEVWTKDNASINWAKAQNNLGIALRTLGERQGGEDAIA